MRHLPIVIAALACACDATPESRESNPPGVAQVRADSAPAPVRTGVDSPPPPGDASLGDGGAAALRELGAAGKKININTLGEGEVDVREFSADETADPSTLAGVYHFGDSEWESELTLEVKGKTVSGVYGYADWKNDGWVGKEIRLDGRIEGSRLVAPGWLGVFVRYEGRPGLVILRAPTDRLGVEFGRKL